MIPVLAALALGFVKGWVNPGNTSFNLQSDVYAPIKEELLYRGGPLWLFPNLPFGVTALAFAVDHVLDDLKSSTPATTGDLVGRFGDVLFGGLAYEAAYRRHGIFAAIAAHSAHNAAITLGSQVRGTPVVTS